MTELTQNQLKILEKLSENLREDTISLIYKSKEKFNKRFETYSNVTKLYKQGLGWKKIIELTDISKNIIDTWLYRGIKPRYRLILPDAIDTIKRLGDSGLNDVEIGNLLNVTFTTVARLASGKRFKNKRESVLPQEVIDFIKTSDNPLEALGYLWLVKINQKSLDNAKVFCEFVKLQGKMSFFGLCRKLGKSYVTLSTWRKGKHVPWLIRWLELYFKLGKPRDGYVWLPLSLDFRIDKSQVIEVPSKIEKWDDISQVIEKLPNMETDSVIANLSKEECLGFVLGMMIGDVGKRAKRRDRLDLQLTTRSETNMKLGNFFCECLKKLGFRAYRTKNTRWFYRWVSQVSPFFNWVYTIVLGLAEKETTTYTPIKVDWLLEAPEDVIRRFLQGVYESDGCVTTNNQISCSVDPNVNLIQTLLNRFNIKSSIRKEKYKEVAIYGIEGFRKANNLLFAPEIKTERYQLLNMMVDAKFIEYNKIPAEIRDEITKSSGKGISKIQKILLKRYSVRVTKEAVKKVLNSPNYYSPTK